MFQESRGMGTDGTGVIPEHEGKPVSGNGGHMEKPVHKVTALDKSWSNLLEVHLLH